MPSRTMVGLCIALAHLAGAACSSGNDSTRPSETSAPADASALADAGAATLAAGSMVFELDVMVVGSGVDESGHLEGAADFASGRGRIDASGGAWPNRAARAAQVASTVTRSSEPARRSRRSRLSTSPPAAWTPPTPAPVWSTRSMHPTRMGAVVA